LGAEHQLLAMYPWVLLLTSLHVLLQLLQEGFRCHERLGILINRQTRGAGRLVLLLPLLLEELLVVPSSTEGTQAKCVLLVRRELLRLGRASIVWGTQANRKLLASRGHLSAGHLLPGLR
jgi:hypothetical protein